MKLLSSIGLWLLRQLVRPVCLWSIVTGFRRTPAPTPAELSRGCVVLLAGVDGTTWTLGACVGGLRAAGIECGIEAVYWGWRPFGTFHNLMNLRASRAEAQEIAECVAARQASYPGAPVTLVGFSGGGGLALMIAEALPDGVMLERIVLVGAAA